MATGTTTEMTLTRSRALLALALINVVYWVPAWFFPDQVKGAVNAALLMLSLMTSMILVPDMWDVWARRGDGISWQGLAAKVGLFTLSMSFFLTRVWALLLAQFNYPDNMLHGPIGGFLPYMMGLGLLGIYVGFSGVGTAYPRVTPRGAVLAALLIGVVVGVVVAKLPV